MNDRGMIKWQPFDSLTNSKKMKKEIAKSKIKIKMPILSEDQLEKINDNIINAYNSYSLIKIKYYFNNNILIKESKIKKIDFTSKQIILNDNTKLYYKQIIDIDMLY